MISRARRAFTLIELLVVMAIIAMVLALAAPAVMNILKTTSLTAAQDVLRAGVSTTRSAAISSRRSCVLDIRNIISPDGRQIFTDSISTSALLVAEDFETYSDGNAEGDLDLRETWFLEPDEDVWELHTQSTRELWAGRRRTMSWQPYAENVYAWNVESRTVEGPSLDVDVTVMARFRARQVTGFRGAWGFGLMTNYTRTAREASGYRFAVRVEATSSGWNSLGKAQIEKINNSSNPAKENMYVAKDTSSASSTGGISVREIDDDSELTCAFTPGVWYWAKMRMNRSQSMVTLAGKVWVDGSPEPADWTVGPVYDRWPDSVAPLQYFDGFTDGSDPFDGGFCGVWSAGAEMAVDDFAVDRRKSWLLPKGIYMQPKRVSVTGDVNVDDMGLVALDRYEPGSFPLTYRPDGTAASNRSVLLVITNITSGETRAVTIDRNTGRVDNADDLSQFE